MASPIFGRITVMEMGNCRAGSQLRFTENPAPEQKKQTTENPVHRKSGASSKNPARVIRRETFENRDC